MVSLLLLLRVQEPQYPGDGDRDPVGSVIQLIAQLVHGLLELEDREKLLGRLLPRGQQRSVHCMVVPGEEALTRTLLPARWRLNAAQQLRAGCRIRERSQHPGDVAQRRALQ